ncbi:MAG: NADH-quinone oxidoreductase subunit M, partial [Chloroflexi bacterium]|nr:NADH-quinone oxidoreductase subunit M [Chloroflexota bacterium]
TAGSVILAGVLLKMGTYGFIRFNLPLFPEAAKNFAPLIIALALIGIIYGAIVSIVQRDIKSLVAFSSVSHLGYVMLGLFVLNAQGITGGILQMINHGLSTGALFLLVGMLYERRHTRLIADFGGVAKVMPIYAAFFLIVMFSSVGLPGLNGFVGEFLILVGAFQANVWYAVFAATGVVLSAIYLLWMYQRAMNGPITHDENKSLKDLSPREIALLVALVVFIVWIGVYPKTFLDPIQASVANLLGMLK